MGRPKSVKKNAKEVFDFNDQDTKPVILGSVCSRANVVGSMRMTKSGFLAMCQSSLAALKSTKRVGSHLKVCETCALGKKIAKGLKIYPAHIEYIELDELQTLAKTVAEPILKPISPQIVYIPEHELQDTESILPVAKKTKSVAELTSVATELEDDEDVLSEFDTEMEN